MHQGLVEVGDARVDVAEEVVRHGAAGVRLHGALQRLQRLLRIQVHFVVDDAHDRECLRVAGLDIERGLGPSSPLGPRLAHRNGL